MNFVLIHSQTSFRISKHEVVQAVWQKIMLTKPWHGKKNVQEGSNYPATYVLLENCLKFCRSVQGNLPTET